MKAVIELSATEFTKDAFEQIKRLLINRKDAKVRISIEHEQAMPTTETKDEYFERLDKSIKQAEEGKVVTFTWDEFETYTKQMLNEP